MFLSRRKMTPELMDAPDVSPELHLEALGALGRINHIANADRIIARCIFQYAKKNALSQFKILDVACGGGDVPITVAKRLIRCGIRVELGLLDMSQTALNRAARLAQKSGVPAQTFCGDALQIPIPDSFDVLTSSLFFHHLSADGARAMLTRMRALAHRLIVINDLRRSCAGFAAAWLGCRLLTSNSLIRNDGPVSVQAAWTIPELRALAADAGLADARIRRCRNWRMLLAWEKK